MSKNANTSSFRKIKSNLLSLNFIIPSILFIGVFILYLHHLSPSIYGYDSGDFASAVITKGVPHASGYPLYTMLGILFNFLPFQTPAWKIGLISVFSSSFAVLLAYLTINAIIKNKLASLIGALIVAFYYPFWLYAEVVEVMALNTFFVFLLVFIAVKYWREKKNIYIYLLFLSTGLSLTNNQVILLLFPAVFIVFLPVWKQLLKIKRFTICLCLFTLGLTPYLYIILSSISHPSVDNAHIKDLETFFHFVLRKTYGWGIADNFISTFKPVILIGISYMYSVYVFKELGALLAAIIFIGVIYFIISRKYMILSILLTGFLTTGPFFYLYTRTPPKEYFQIGLLERFVTSSSILLIIFISIGLFFIAKLTDRVLSRLLLRSIKTKIPYISLTLVIFFVFPAKLLLNNFRVTDLHEVRIGDNLAEDLLNSLPKNSLVLIYDDTVVYNTQYVKFSKDIRRDVDVVTDYIKLTNYIDNNKMTRGVPQKLEAKYKDIDPITLTLISISYLKEKRPVIYMFIPPYDIGKYKKEIKFIPYGISFKLADEKDLGQDEEDFIKQQDRLLTNTHLREISNRKLLIDSNYNFIHIKGIYVKAYFNTALYLRNRYNDEKAAQIYFKKAKKIDEDLEKYLNS